MGTVGTVGTVGILGTVGTIDPFPDLLHYRLFPCHGGHFGGHNCIGAFG